MSFTNDFASVQATYLQAKSPCMLCITGRNQRYITKTSDSQVSFHFGGTARFEQRGNTSATVSVPNAERTLLGNG